ncbi:MAG: hypothetical protein ACOYKZ_03620 [Chlamydiia bacterium]
MFVLECCAAAGVVGAGVVELTYATRIKNLKLHNLGHEASKQELKAMELLFDGYEDIHSKCIRENGKLITLLGKAHGSARLVRVGASVIVLAAYCLKKPASTPDAT